MIGFDYLGMASKHWPVELTKRMTPRGSALGLFDSPLFGPYAVENLRQHLDTGKFPAVRVQIWWDHNANWQRGHTPVPLDFLRLRCGVWGAVAKDYPSVKFYLSPATEHTVHVQGVLDKWKRIVNRLAPNCTFVNNPWTGLTMDGEINETHDYHSMQGRYFASMDGIEDPDVQHWHSQHRNALIKFVWNLPCNMKGLEPPMPPSKRTAAPTEWSMKQLLKMARA